MEHIRGARADAAAAAGEPGCLGGGLLPFLKLNFLITAMSSSRLVTDLKSHLVVLARRKLGRPGPGPGDGMDGQATPVQQRARRLSLDHVPELNVWAAIRGSPKEVVLKMLTEDSEKV